MNITRRYSKLRPLIVSRGAVRNAGVVAGVGTASVADINNAIATHSLNPVAHLQIGAGLRRIGANLTLGPPSTLTSGTTNQATSETHTHSVLAFDAGSGNGHGLIKFDGSGGLSPTKVTTPEAIGTTSFVSGFTGAGYRVLDSGGIAAAEFDELVVRGRMRVYELLVHQIRATNGSIFVSNTAKIKTVTGTGPYTLTVEDDTAHGFAANDLIRAQRFTGSGVYQSNMTVSSVTNATTFVAALSSGDAPAAGMEFVRLGNTTDTARQGSIYLTADDTNAPYMDISDGVSSFAEWGTAAKIKARLGRLVSGLDATLSPSGWGLYSQNVFLKGALIAGGGNVAANSDGLQIVTDTNFFASQRVSFLWNSLSGAEQAYVASRSSDSIGYQLSLAAKGVTAGGWGTIALRARTSAQSITSPNDAEGGTMLVTPENVYVGPNKGLIVSSDGGHLADTAAAGRVGIGIGAPGHPLHVGAGAASSILTSTTGLIVGSRAGTAGLSLKNSTDSVETLMYSATASGNIGTGTNHPLIVRTNNAEVGRWTTDGRLGINKAAPDSRLHIVGTNDDTGGIRIESSAGTAALRGAIYGRGNVSLAFKRYESAGSFQWMDNTDAVAMVFDGSNNLGIGANPPIAKLHVVQGSATAAIPTLLLSQADLSEELIQFASTVGTGNPIEAKGSKTLTPTHFVRVRIAGVGLAYLQVGTIA